MTIKHLVLSGGGPIGMSYLGALEHLHDEGFWKIENIQSIYATSIGAMVAVAFALKYDWETMNTYFIDRPWNDLFKLNGKQIMDLYTTKGLFDSTYTDKIFKPLLQAKDLSLSITMKEFYEYNKIEIYFYTFDINSYGTIELSYKNYPDLPLTKAIYMSCSIPGIFIPTFLDDKCLIDGFPLANFPINYCIRDHSERDDILGLNFIYDKPDELTVINNNNNTTINNETNMLQFILSILTNTFNFIKNISKEETVPNIIEFTSSTGTNNLDDIKNFLNSAEHRKSLFDSGVECGKKFIEKQRLVNIKKDGKEKDGNLEHSI